MGVQIPTLTQQNFNFRSITHTTNIADEYEFQREKGVFFLHNFRILNYSKIFLALITIIHMKSFYFGRNDYVGFL